MLHSVTLGADGTRQMKFHGSHEFEEPIFPINTADLFLGSKRSGNFRGYLGTFGIFRGADLQERFSEILSELGELPRVLPHDLEDEEIMLFVPNTKQDLSSVQHSVKVRGIGEFSEKKESSKKHTSKQDKKGAS